jgi:hypothetical protein
LWAHEKAHADRAPYDLWAEADYIEAAPGKTIGYDFLAERVKETFEEFEVETFVFDAWHFATLKDALIRAGFPPKQIDARFVAAPQTFKWMSPAVRSFETAILEQRHRHGANPVLTMRVANVAIERNAAGERKFTKRKTRCIFPSSPSRRRPTKERAPRQLDRTVDRRGRASRGRSASAVSAASRNGSRSAGSTDRDKRAVTLANSEEPHFGALNRHQ